MKKLFLALSVLAMLIFAAVPSHALLSMPDAVPGTDVLLPFFLSKITSGESTLIVVQEVDGNATTLTVDVFDIDSTSRHDTSETLSGYDVGAWNVRDDWVANASSTDKAALEIDLDGDGTNDHYAGYVKMVNSNTCDNNLVAFIYQIDLASGVASGALAVTEECEKTVTTNANLVDGNDIEVFDATALVTAKALLAGVAPQAAASFAMYPRYFVYNSNGHNYLFSWRSTDRAVTRHLDFYNDEEKSYSGNITLTHELDILNITDILPSGHMSAYPYVGWINFTLANYNDEWIMYSYQNVLDEAAGTSWCALFDVHRTAGT
ncbi:MAG: hypothetical protein JRL30_13855 [Deltaproteobacteria bacterium]|nr:hypothetical protein [Deltaproteobacteria bacterium]